MVKICSRICLSVFALILSLFTSAQDSLQNDKPQMADALRSNGKIYVVVVVLIIILMGLFGYLVNTDRRISRMEKNIK
ncbi:MAG TPA: CcmD family protein [Puia sp.]|jgi:predicted negative regulator of RcsB-dependent stress response